MTITATQLADNRRIIRAWLSDIAPGEMSPSYAIRLERLAEEPGAATAQQATVWAADFDGAEQADLLNLASKLY